jgi:hypothetical protein
MLKPRGRQSGRPRPVSAASAPVAMPRVWVSTPRCAGGGL